MVRIFERVWTGEVAPEGNLPCVWSSNRLMEAARDKGDGGEVVR
jgi:hypothetical protein